jgi:hypothetical protein
MPFTDLVGKILYPRQQLWELRRNVKLLFVVVSITLIVIALFGLVILLKGSVQIKLDAPLESAFS